MATKNFSFKNWSNDEIAFGAEPWGHYIEVLPQETIVVAAENIQEMTVGLNDGDAPWSGVGVGRTVIAMWCLGSVKFSKDDKTIFEY